MAMKRCKECGTEISGSAKVCPKCGKEQRNFFQKHIVLTVMLVLVLFGIVLGISGGDNNSENTMQTSTVLDSSIEKEPEIIEYMTIDIDVLEEELKNNAAAAKDKYNGKHLEITGKLGTIDSDLKYISLLSTTDEWDLTGIHCTVKTDEQKNTIKTLSKGDTIVVKGKITNVGEVMGYYLDITEISK